MNYQSWSKSFWHRCKVLSCIWTLKGWISDKYDDLSVVTTASAPEKKSTTMMTALMHPLNPPPFRFLSNSALDANLMAIICFTEKGFFHDKNEKKIWKLKVACGFFFKVKYFCEVFLFRETYLKEFILQWSLHIFIYHKQLILCGV